MNCNFMPFKIKIVAIIATFFLLFGSIGHADERLNVVATTGMIADTTRAIGGEHVTVQGLMGPGVDPHAYRQTRSDIRALTNADLVLWHGLYLEAQLDSFLKNLSNRKPVFALGERIDPSLLLADEDHPDRPDPHIWMDPELWQLVSMEIRDILIEQYPEGESTFRKNAEDYQQQLAALSDYVTEITQTVPESARILVTAHDAFGYFANAYGFDVEGIQGISTESEAGLNRIRELVDLLVDQQVKAVFVESSVSDRNIRALIEGAKAQGHDVIIGGELFSDAMGPEGTYEGTYIGMIDHNATTITRALGGDAPSKGMQGKLTP